MLKTKRKPVAQRYDEEAGVWVRAWVANNRSSVRQPVEALARAEVGVHVVELENLKTYPIDVRIVGRVDEGNAKIDFETDTGGLRRRWAFATQIFRSARRIDHVRIRPRERGEDLISTNIVVADVFGPTGLPSREEQRPLEMSLTIR